MSRDMPGPSTLGVTDGLQLHERAFKVSSSKKDGDNTLGWRDVYALSRVLGEGVSAMVYEGETKETMGISEQLVNSPPKIASGCGRAVAIKLFRRSGTLTFRMELLALQRAGAHPHILRLLESYKGYGGEDILVLEHCDGATVYELYAKGHKAGISYEVIARLIRQLFLALQHLVSRGIEHQDVKPENMMLYIGNPGEVQLKLGDFGWASVSEEGPRGEAVGADLPAGGAGSLWYAAPELNPQVEGVPTRGQRRPGRSDVWSVGVVCYLLLVGHNPFNLARKSGEKAADAEVLRLVALGDFNRASPKWVRLEPELRDFISMLLQVDAGARPSATEVLLHPFLAPTSGGDATAPAITNGWLSNVYGREEDWNRLDGLQQLGWVAMARAVAEPELMAATVTSAVAGVQVMSHGYLWQLAREMATSPVEQWLKATPAWGHVLRLAFRYLDVDGDGALSAEDIAAHFTDAPDPSPATSRSSPAKGTSAGAAAAYCSACTWVAKWRDPDAPPASAHGYRGLSLGEYTASICAPYCDRGVLREIMKRDFQETRKEPAFDFDSDGFKEARADEAALACQNQDSQAKTKAG